MEIVLSILSIFFVIVLILGIIYWEQRIYPSVIFVKERKTMNINDFAKEVTLEEGKKKQISIAQVKEVLKIVNTKLDNRLYKLIKEL